MDYYARPKPAFYAFKRASQPVILSLEQKDGKLKVHCCNDSLEQVRGKAKLYLYDTKAEKNLWEREFAFETEANSSAVVHTELYSEIEGMAASAAVLICDAATNLGDDRALLIARRFADLALEYADVEILSRDEKAITVRAKTFTPFVLLDEENLLEENCFMLKAGETKTVRFVR